MRLEEVSGELFRDVILTNCLVKLKTVKLSEQINGMQDLGERLPRALAKAKRPATVQRILKAAETIFADRGLAGARTGAIARAARVNNALLYYYFRNKAGIYRFTLKMVFSQLRSQAGAALDGPGSPRERLHGYVNAYFDFVAEHPTYPRLVQRQLLAHGPGLDGIVENYFRPLNERLMATIRAGVESGDFRNVDPRQTALSIVAITVFYFAAAPVLAELWKCDPLKPANLAARRTAVLDFLEHALFALSGRTR
jgi:TetR/AcrR family transcriptional regulator